MSLKIRKFGENPKGIFFPAVVAILYQRNYIPFSLFKICVSIFPSEHTAISSFARRQHEKTDTTFFYRIVVGIRIIVRRRLRITNHGDKP